MSTKAAILLTTLGILNAGIAYVFVGTVLSENRGNDSRIGEAPPVVDHVETRHRQPLTSSCAPCPKCRPVVVPRLPQPQAAREMTCAAVCEEKIDRYQQMLEDIQKWCNPHCEEQLADCRQLVSHRYSDPNGLFRMDEI